MAKAAHTRKPRAGETKSFTGDSETTVNVPMEVPQINTATPICMTPQPQEYEPLQNSNTTSQQNNTPMNCNTMQQSPPLDTTTCNTTTACCCSTTQNLSLADRINRLSKNMQRMDSRMSWQEQIHGNILGNGNVTHYYNVIPTVVIATVTGGVIAFVVTKLLTRRN